jgi:hypothetical protein
MKKLLLLSALAVIACSNAALETKTILVLPDATYRFNGAAISLADSRSLLGDPAFVQVNIKGCPRTREEAVLKLLRSLRSNGYSRIAFETGSADAACPP